MAEEEAARKLMADELADEPMAAYEREAARRHILQCDQCLALFRDVNNFFEPRREDETGMNELDVHRAWRDLRRRLHNAEVIAAPPAQSSPGRPRINLRRAAAIAAGLLIANAEAIPAPPANSWRGGLLHSNPLRAAAIAIGLLIAITPVGFWALRLRRENQQLAAQVRTLRQESEARVAQAESSARQLQAESSARQQQARSLRQDLERQLAELKQPQINAPTYGLMPLNQRTGEKTAPTVIALPPGARFFTLTLTMENPEPNATYTLEIVDRLKQVARRVEGLKPDENQSFTIILPHDFLKPGEYRLRLFKRGASRSKPDAEYSISVKSPR